MLDLDTQVKLFKEYLENGGYEKLKFPNLIKSLDKVKMDLSGKVIPDTVDSTVQSAINAYIAEQLMEPYTSSEHISQYETFIQKDIFFNQAFINSKEELEDFIFETGNKSDLIFRGVTEARWSLYSSLQRHWIINNYAKKEISHKEFIIDLIKNGREMYQNTLQNFLIKNDIDPENDLAILSFLQHHGQPTPLLDWTEDLGNALYFAIDGLDPRMGTREIHQYFSIYILEEKLFSEVGIKQIMEKKIKTYSGKFREGLEKYAKQKEIASDTYDKLFSEDIMKEMTIMKIGNKFASGLTNVALLYNLPFAFFSDSLDDKLKFGMNNNLRITNQKGVFTWNTNPTLPLEYIILKTTNADNNSESNMSVCSCINIHKSLAKEVKDFLDHNNITKEYIYPNSELLAKESFNKSLKNFKLSK